ncbi:hypothetical protein I2485_10615 [Nesterenkonia sp. E16_7]|uniref:aldose epimerase family protein n=1 Tax=unclassified Nesterenkonia TaxID=2629769 RepID=UPI001A9298CA|nr:MULTISPECIES: hypothetical protein [unclassified Nesterenkonia]MBO0595456.1 hypothetical protein [Nesterenkonia sp. E16_10]MBO0599096.1 hypothetical protein [Nesterenkonia sp. E16_7]
MDATNSVSITGGGYAAQISLLGGQLLNLTHQEDELIVPAAKTEGAFAGAVLAPWPNRTKGGRYTFNGVEHLLPVNEEATGAALHGLLIDLPLRVVSQKESEVQLAGWLESSEGYPFGLDIALTYRVSADLGLAATLMARYRPEELAEDAAPDQDAPLAESEDTLEPAEGLEVADLQTPDDAGNQDADTDRTESEAPDGEAAEAEGADTEAEVSEDAEGEDTEAEATEDEGTEDEGPEGASTETDSSTAPEATDTDPSPAPVPQTAPFGAGFHPYLTAGGASLRECRLRLPARTLLKTKSDGTVTGRKTVAQDFDLTHGPLLSGRTIDHAFTDLPEEGWTAELIHGPSGFVVRMIADSPWVQVYTGERIDRAGIAVEPMTCPPNALNSGEDLIHLEPGKWFRMGYSIEAIRAG